MITSFTGTYLRFYKKMADDHAMILIRNSDYGKSGWKPHQCFFLFLLQYLLSFLLTFNVLIK